MATVLAQTPRRPGPPGQPDIEYTPDPHKYRARTARRQAEEELGNSLPPGFPQKLESPLVWDGESVKESYNWTYELTADDVEEIEAGLKHFKCTSLSMTRKRHLLLRG